jgi:hypothetical protein
VKGQKAEPSTPSRVARSPRLMSMLFLARSLSWGRSSTSTSGIPEPAATAARFLVQMSGTGSGVSVTLMLGYSAWKLLTIRRMALRRTGELQKCQKVMSPLTSFLAA